MASSLLPSAPRRVYGGLLISKSERGSGTSIPRLSFAPMDSCVPEKDDWISEESNQSSEPRRIPCGSSRPSRKVCSCICSNLADGDMAASVAAVRWIAAGTTSAPGDGSFHQCPVQHRVCGRLTAGRPDGFAVSGGRPPSRGSRVPHGRVNYAETVNRIDTAPIQVRPVGGRQSPVRPGALMPGMLV